MQIGRKIYYDLATGNVILARESRNGGDVDTTTEQDFVTYAELAERVPSTVGEIQFEFGQYDTEFASGGVPSVDLSTLAITFAYLPPTTQPPSVSLDSRIIALENARLADMLGI